MATGEKEQDSGRGTQDLVKSIEHLHFRSIRLPVTAPAPRPYLVLLPESRVLASQHGFTYIGLLIVIVILGIGLAAGGVVFHQQLQREKEKELLFAGDQIRHAIAQYYEKSPGGNKRFPEALEDLLMDQRYPATQRYLRRLYREPMIVSGKWDVLRAPDGGILGVHSSSTQTPIKKDNFPAGFEDFADARSYVDWKFVYAVPVETPAPAGSGGIATPPRPARATLPGPASTMPAPGGPARH